MSSAIAGEPIQMQNGRLVALDRPIVPFIEGDGTGPDIWRASKKVFDAAVAKAYRVSLTSPSFVNTLKHFFNRQHKIIQAVDNVSFDIQPGEFVGFLGPNGAGKSTTVKMLTGLLEPSSGRVLFHGEDIRRDLKGFQRRLGYVPEEPHLYPHLSGREYLQLAGRADWAPSGRSLWPDRSWFSSASSRLRRSRATSYCETARSSPSPPGRPNQSPAVQSISRSAKNPTQGLRRPPASAIAPRNGAATATAHVPAGLDAFTPQASAVPDSAAEHEAERAGARFRGMTRGRGAADPDEWRRFPPAAYFERMLPRLAATDKRAKSFDKDCFDFTQQPRPFKAIPAALSQSYFEREPPDPRPPDNE